MSYITQKKFALSFILFLSFTTNAQHLYEIKNEKDFDVYFFNEAAKYNDTLCTTKRSGLVFIKFMIKENGLIDRIKFTEKQPPILLQVITKVLSRFKMDVAGGWDKNATYVLPLSYYYVPELTLPITAEKMLDQVPRINPDSLMAYMNFDFNGFFNVEESQKSLWGIKCVLLPMIKIFRPMVFHYDIKKEEKADLKKPKYQLNQ